MKKYTGFKDFLEKKGIEISARRYLIEAMKYMAFGLFGTLLMGSILNQIGVLTGITFLSEVIWPAAKAMTGPAIAVSIAYALEAPPLVMFSITIAGMLGNAEGGPAGAYIAAIIGTEFGKAISGETKIDILLTPFVTIIVGGVFAVLVGSPIGALMTGLGNIIMWSTAQQPVIMGIVIAVVVGLALTLPISSAALCIMLNLSGIAAGAAVVGCCCQMVGFAVQSYPENGIGGLLAQGVGTSMLQVPNIVKNWKIWIPPTLAAAVLGPFATTVFQVEATPITAGMGTCGFVGQIGTAMAMGASGASTQAILMAILLMEILFPALVTLFFYKIGKTLGWYKKGDMKLDL